MNIQKTLGALCLAILLTSCNGNGVSPQLSSGTVPNVRTAALSKSAGIQVTEIAVPTAPMVLAVGPNGAVYFGNAQSAGGGGNLYRYSNGAFVQTTPWVCPYLCGGSGVTAIDAAYRRTVVWASTYQDEGHSFPYTRVEFGGSGGTATTSQALSFKVGWIQSIVTSHTGRLWLGGTGESPNTAPAGYPAELPYYSYQSFASLILANGPRKHVWAVVAGYAGAKVNTIFEFSPSGSALNRFPLPAGTVIAASNDGSIGNTFMADAHHLWFADAGHNAIGEMTPSGHLTEHSIPTPNSGVGGVALAADGSVWFIENANKIGRLSRRGRITEYTLPTPGFLTGVAANPKAPGCNPRVLWVGEINSSGPNPANLVEVTY